MGQKLSIKHKIENCPCDGTVDLEPQHQTEDVKIIEDPYLTFPFFTDEPSITYLRHSKTMFIMRGLPGSGKSFLAKNLTVLYENSAICSADHYFYGEDGEYKFDVSRLGDAHNQCKVKVLEALDAQKSIVIVDNTNVRYWEMKFYVMVAKKFHYNILVIEPKTPWKFDSAILAKNNSHGVDITIIRSKIEIYEPIRPLYYGWFLNDIDSLFLRKMSNCWLERLCELEDFQKFSHSQGLRNLSDDWIKHFNKHPKEMGKFENFHCTARYTARFTTEDETYIQNEEVANAIGKVFSLDVVGFTLTERTLGARVRLTPSQQDLWSNKNTVGDVKVSSNSPKQKSDFKHHRSPTTAHTIPIPDYKLLEKDITTTATLRVISYDTNVQDKSTAHITLGTAHGVVAAQTGRDLDHVIQLECSSEQLYKEYKIAGGKVRQFEENTWVIYPEKMANFQSLFAFAL